MNCPECKIKMLIVFFKYENGEVLADGKGRYLCDVCGYQKLIKEIDKSEWKIEKPKLFEYDSKNGIVDIFVKQDPDCPFPFHEEDWYHQGFYKKEFLRIVDEFLQKNSWGKIQYEDDSEWGPPLKFDEEQEWSDIMRER